MGAGSTCGMRTRFLAAWCLLVLWLGPGAGAQVQQKDAADALRKSIDFYHSISTRGGYLWRYSVDLKERWGEGTATPTQVWVQPPGTPAVGQAFLRAYQVTKDPRYLDYAREAALALSYGQLESGGWDYRIDFDPTSNRWRRRADVGRVDQNILERRRNTTVFDDDNTQSAIRFLLTLADATGDSKDPRDATIRSTLDDALAGLLKAQYPNGAFPQVFIHAPRNAVDYPAIRAVAPADPSALPRVKEYWYFYTFNDHCLRNCVATLLLAHEKTGDARYLAAARNAGDFILLAQLPDPHPAWAQQYDFQMRPAWARKFEPPSVCTSETVGICHTLIDLHQATGDQKYLQPIPRALAWLDKIRLPSGKHARFYELNTNRPLYFTKDYRLVYSDDDLPTHYSFQGDYGDDALKARLASLKAPQVRKPNLSTLEARAKDAIKALDDKGRWLKDGQIDSATFIRNVNVLCDYLQAPR